MENTRLKQEAQTLSHNSSGRRRSSASNSPDFQFWMVRNPSFPTPDLVSADELFVNGVILPLHLLPDHHPFDPPDIDHPPIPPTSEEDPAPVRDSVNESGPPGPELSAVTHESSSTATGLTASKRWKDILFKKGTSDKKAREDKEKEKKKERKSASRTSSAELNINIWPFSRSRSAGNNGSRPRIVAGAPVSRKVSSAPCSRSNSAGESKSRKWPSSPSRAGVHLGRSSPVWQVRRGGSGLKPSEPAVRNVEKGVKKEVPECRRSKIPTAASPAVGGGGAKAKVLNLNVPMCISYRHHLSCRSDENSAISVATGGGNGGGGSGDGGGVAHSGGGSGGSTLFNFRSLFTKKVY